MVIPVGGQTDDYQVQPRLRCRQHRQQHLSNVSLHSLPCNAACQLRHVLRSTTRLQTAAQPHNRPAAAIYIKTLTLCS